MLDKFLLNILIMKFFYFLGCLIYKNLFLNKKLIKINIFLKFFLIIILNDSKTFRHVSQSSLFHPENLKKQIYVQFK